MAKKESEKIFTPGNIILGIIIIALISSLFFDFFGKKEELPLGCPQPIRGLIVTNVIFSGDGVIFTQDRDIKPEFDPEASYRIEALLRNTWKEDIELTSLLLTSVNLGPGEVLIFNESIVVKANSISVLNVSVPRGDYHKIDIYSTPCEGVVMFHEVGDGSKYAWELEAEEEAAAAMESEEVMTDEVMEEETA